MTDPPMAQTRARRAIGILVAAFVLGLLGVLLSFVLGPWGVIGAIVTLGALTVALVMTPIALRFVMRALAPFAGDRLPDQKENSCRSDPP